MSKLTKLLLLLVLTAGISLTFNSCSKESAQLGDESELIVTQSPEDIEMENEAILKCAGWNWNRFNKCGNSATYFLYASQHYKVGTVTIMNDENHLYVIYSVWGWWLSLTETHLYVGSKDKLPVAKGNPIPGKFNYQKKHPWGTKIHTYKIPLTEINQECVVIATHAVINGQYTAWSKTECSFQNELGGKKWGWFVCDFCIKKCDVPVEPKELVFGLKATYGFYFNCGQPEKCYGTHFALSGGDIFKSTQNWCAMLGYVKFDVNTLTTLEVPLIDDGNEVMGTIYLTKNGNSIEVTIDSEADHIVKNYVFIGTEEDLESNYLDHHNCPLYLSFPYYSVESNGYVKIDLSVFE